MVGISKEDVLNWYQGLNASHRLETICALLDHSLPFELRFLGSVIENLGRKDFHVLRDAECRTNSLHSSESAPDHAAILKLLSEGPTPTAMTLNPQMATSIGSFNSHCSSSVNENSAARPSPTNSNDQKTTDPGKSSLEAPKPSENGLTSKVSTLLTSEVSGKGTEKSNLVASANHVEVNPEENKDSRQDIWLHDGAKRRKLILYLSLLAATNHDSANLYFILMSEVQDLMENLEWLEGSDQMVQDEIQLLYTIGSHHPAFNFEQRTFLSTVLNRFKECMISCSKHGGQNFHDSPSPPNQILNHHYLPPQHFEGKFGGYYYYAPPQLQNIQCTQQSNPQSVTGSSDGVRATNYPFVSYPNFPVFMSPPHPHHHPMGHQFQGHPFGGNVMGSTLPVHGSVLQPHPFPQQVTIAPTSVSLPISSPSAGAQPIVSNKVQPQSPNLPGTHPQSHQSSVSTPTRTSSMASAVTAFQSQANSLDGDSEESSENCAWDSPESSPFESPPQSMTPSRSQSPRAAGLHLRNTVQASPTTNSSAVVSPVVAGGIHNSNTLVNCERLSHPSTVSEGIVTSSSSSQSSVTLSKPSQRSNMSDRKGRPYIAGVSTLSNPAPPPPHSATQQLPLNISSLTSTTSPSTSLAVSTVSMTNSSLLSSSQSSATQQRLGLNSHSSQCMPLPCSNNNASYTNSTSSVSSSGDCAQMPKSVSCSNSSTNLVTSGGMNNSSLSTVNTSAYSSNNFNTILSISSSASAYPVPLPQHHAVNQSMMTAANNYSESFNNPTSMGLVNTVNAGGYGNAHKSSSSIHSQSSSSQGRMQAKSNSVSNHNQQSANQLGAQQAQQHVIQQLMGQVVGQLQPSSASVNNLVGVVTHSSSMNTPLLSYGHPSGALNNHGHSNYSGYPPTGVSFSAMGGPGTFRPNPQAPMLNRPAAFMPSHPGSMMNNQMVMKQQQQQQSQQQQQQQQDQRNHTGGGHSSLRKKNPSIMTNHNTPKRRNSNNPVSTGSNSAVTTTMGSNSSSIVAQAAQIVKSEETNEMKDRTNNILVVSANPPKNPPQHQDNRGKIYHHPNSGFSNGPIPVGERVSTSSSNTSNTLNSNTGNPTPNQVVSSANVSGPVVMTNTPTKCEDNLHNDVGIMDYGIAAASQLPAYHSSGHIYGHSGPSFIPMQNGYLPQSYYPNPVTGPPVGMNTAGPPSTEILMNPGHVQPPYPFTFPFTIPPQQHYGNPSIASKTVCANNPVAKDSSSKTSLPAMGAVGSSLSSDSKLMNDTGVPFGRSGQPPPPSNTQVAASLGGLGLTHPPSLVPMPSSHSPMTSQPIRSRGVVLEVGGHVANAEFPSLSSLENALMPPLEDPVEVNCRPRKISCYNCGSNTHLGPECKEASMEEMTRKQYRLNYGGPSSTESKDGE